MPALTPYPGPNPMLLWAGTLRVLPSPPTLPFPWEGVLWAGKPYTSFQLPAVSFLCRRPENMKSPSRWVQPREARSALHHSPVTELPASCCPSTSCTYHLGRDATNPSRSCALPTCKAHKGLFSWYCCPLKALSWVQVRGHLPVSRSQQEHMHQGPAFF